VIAVEPSSATTFGSRWNVKSVVKLPKDFGLTILMT
jgi:hypothetical protein